MNFGLYEGSYVFLQPSFADIDLCCTFCANRFDLVLRRDFIHVHSPSRDLNPNIVRMHERI